MARLYNFIPLFNDAPFIIKSLRALYDSDLSDVQLIFSDDASEDDTVSLRMSSYVKTSLKKA